MVATPASPRRPRRARGWLIGLGIPVVALALLIALWDWDWFVPLAERRASAALGRPVHIAHLHVALGRTVKVRVQDLRIDNPEGFERDPPFAQAAGLTVRLDAMAFIRTRQVVIPSIELDRPVVQVLETADGRKNYSFDLGADEPAGEEAPDEAKQAGPKIGELRIAGGTARVVIPRLRTDAQASVETRQPEGAEPQVVVEARGTYAAQPVTAQLTGGALLSLRDEERPWPVELRLANGATRMSLVGTIRNPLQLAGADLRLELAGPDMTLLQPLTGVAIPNTPPYQLSGRLDYAAARVRFRDIQGRLGRSDIAGTITVLPTGVRGNDRPDVTAELRSRSVDLNDLAGFIGSQPTRPNTPGQTPQQRAAAARAEASSRLLPTTPINLPRLTAADVHLDFRGERIVNAAPLERLDVAMDIVGGEIRLHPIRFGIGQGGIDLQGTLTPGEGGTFRSRLELDARRIDVSKLLAPTGFRGQGQLGGTARIDANGRSLGDLLGRGNGEVTAVVVGGDLSALLVDLSGLQFGRAVLSALGVPTRAQLRCFIADFALNRGTLQSRTLVLDSDSSVIEGQGSVDLTRERLDLRFRSDGKRVSVGSLPTPITITGSLKNPSVGIDPTELALRGGAAIGLGILAGPLGLLPTIQLGTEDSAACTGLLNSRGGAPQRRR